MRPLRLSQIAAMTAGRLIGEDVLVDRLLTDTRGLSCVGPAACASSMFVALKGARFDGHDHVSAAADEGIGAALVSRVVGDLPQVQVGDTQLALADLARGLQASRSAKKRPRPVASARPRTPPCVTGFPVTHPSASSCPGLSA